MKAVIELDVPEWQIGQEVSVYFPDTMLKHGKCEMMKEQEAVVRCKDCINKECFGREGKIVLCDLDGFSHKPDWFCADGEREEGR